MDADDGPENKSFASGFCYLASNRINSPSVASHRKKKKKKKATERDKTCFDVCRSPHSLCHDIPRRGAIHQMLEELLVNKSSFPTCVNS
jgi:hypothetical protein